MAGPGSDIGTESFRQGALETAGGMPIIFIDPDAFEAGKNIDLAEHEQVDFSTIPQGDADIMRQTLNDGAPGLGDSLSNEDLKTLTGIYINGGPRALTIDHDGQRYCMVGDMHASIDEKEEFIPSVAHVPLDQLKEIPGTNEEWQRLIGRHEGEHCDDPSEIMGETDFSTEDKRVLHMLQMETKSDRVAIDIQDGSIPEEVIDAYKDYRGLVAGDEHDDFDHASGPMLDGDGSTPVTQDHVDGAAASVPAMVDAVANTLGISEEAARTMRKEDPNTFIDTVETALENGDFDNPEIPELQNFVADYTDAYRSQVEGSTPQIADTPTPDQAAPESDSQFNDLFPYEHSFLDPANGGDIMIAQGETQDTITIGGASASSYFANIADPALAQQRIDAIAAQDMAISNPAVTAEQNVALDTLKT